MARKPPVRKKMRKQTSRPISSLLLGLAGTLAVAAAYLAGLDHRAELHALDLRLRYCSRSRPPDHILHVDIDDHSLTEVGRWPWPREWLAGVVGVLRDCGAREIILDIIMPEPQQVRYVAGGAEVYGGRQAQIIQEQPPVPVFDDLILAEAIGAKRDVFLPMHIDLESRDKSPLAVRLTEALTAEPALSIKQAAARIGGDEGDVEAMFRPARQEAIDTRVDRILAREPQASFQAVLSGILGGKGGRSTLANGGNSAPSPFSPGVLDAVEESYLRCRGLRALRRFGILEGRVSGLPMRSGAIIPPLVVFAQEAALSGFVTFRPDADGVVRRIPLLARAGELLYPQFAFAAAREELARRHGGRCVLSADAGGVTLECADGTRRRIPVDRDGCMLIQWAQATWASEGESLAAMHIPAAAAARVWQDRVKLRGQEDLAQGLRVSFLRLGRQLPAGNQALSDLYNELMDLGESLDQAYRRRVAGERMIQRQRLYDPANAPKADVIAALRRQEEQVAAKRRSVAEKLVQELRKPGNIDVFLGKPVEPAPATQPAELARQRQEHRETLARYQDAKAQAQAALDALDALPAAKRRMEADLAKLTGELRAIVVDKICLIGSTATGAADFVPTPLHARTPGVVVHSNILHTVLSGDFLRTADSMTNLLAILAMGVIVSLLGATARALQTAALVGALGAGYAAVNAWVIFGIGKLWLVLVSPLAAMFASFLLITVYRQLTEERAKKQIKDLFAHALSPALVDRLLEDPSLLELGGQKRPLSCIFADIAGFTALSERLGPQETVRLLNRYFDRVTEVVQSRRGGYLNKFLGDGVFCFFGAPVFQDDHPARAVQAAVDCQAEVTQLNEALSQELGTRTGLSVRIGITTGEAMVGNCGSTERMDYTAIGDCVNLASRLEAANKTFGTRILASDEAWRQGGKEDLLARPLGGVMIAGFAEPVRVWEILGPRQGTAAQKIDALADFARAIELFEQHQFAPAIELLEKVRSALPDDTPTRIFLDLCRQGLAGKPVEDLRPQYKKPEETLRFSGESGSTDAPGREPPKDKA